MPETLAADSDFPPSCAPFVCFDAFIRQLLLGVDDYSGGREQSALGRLPPESFDGSLDLSVVSRRCV